MLQKQNFLEWQPFHYPVMVFCSSRAIYLGFLKSPLWGRVVFLSRFLIYFKIDLGMAQLYDLIYLSGIDTFNYNSAIPCNGITACWNGQSLKPGFPPFLSHFPFSILLSKKIDDPAWDSIHLPPESIHLLQVNNPTGPLYPATRPGLVCFWKKKFLGFGRLVKNIRPSGFYLFGRSDSAKWARLFCPATRPGLVCFCKCFFLVSWILPFVT